MGTSCNTFLVKKTYNATVRMNEAISLVSLEIVSKEVV